MWNANIKRSFGNLLVEAAYIGNKGTHVFAGFGGDYDFNQATIEGFGTLTTNQRKPYFNRFGWSQNFRYYGSDALGGQGKTGHLSTLQNRPFSVSRIEAE